MKTRLKRILVATVVAIFMVGFISTLEWSDLFGFVAEVNANETSNPYCSEYGLDQLSDEQRDAYVRLQQAAEQAVKSDYATKPLYAGQYIFASVTVPQDLTAEEIQEVLAFFRLNNPIYYWSSTGAYSIGSNATTILLLSDTVYGTQYKTRYNQIENEIKNQLTYIAEIKDDYRKAKILHDKLADEITYLYEADGITPSREKYAHGADGAFINKKAVCEGYAEAYSLLLNAAGIENCLVTGHSGDTYTELTAHVWNGVKIEGKWYYADVTWDDGESISHNWFLYGQNYHDTQNKEIGGSNDIIYDYPIFENNYCSGEDNEVTKYTVSATDVGAIKVYNQGILLDIASGMEVEEGTVVTIKMNNAVTKPTFYVNGNAITGNSFAVTEDSQISYTLDTVNVTGWIEPLPEQTIEIPHRLITSHPYGPFGNATSTDCATEGNITYITDAGNYTQKFRWLSDNYTDSPMRKEYDVYTDLVNVPSYINIPTQYQRLTYHIIESGESIQLMMEHPSSSAKIVMKDAQGTEYTDGSYIEIGTEVTLSVEEGGSERAATFSYSNGSDGATSIVGNTFTITESSVKFFAQVQTITLTQINPITTEYDVENGTLATVSQLGLQNEVSINTSGGTMLIPLEWDLSNYDENDNSQHDVAITATPVRPSYVTDPSNLINPINVTLHISKGHIISAVNQTFPTSLEVPLGTPRNAISLGLPLEASCTSDETGSNFLAKIKWEVQGDSSPYTMVGTIVRSGYVYETPISVTINETEGFTRIPDARLEYHTNDGIISVLNQAAADQFMITAFIQPVEGHTNRAVSVIIPDGITLKDYADASQLQNIDAVSSTIQEDGSTQVKIVISDSLSESSTISFQMLVALNFNVESYSSDNQTAHDFGMLYAMGEEVPFAMKYEAKEGDVEKSMYLNTQNVIKVRDDYNLSPDGSGIFKVLPIQKEDLYERMRDNYNITNINFFDNVDMPYFTSIQAIIPLPSVIEEAPILGVRHQDILTCVENASGDQELHLNVNNSFYIYTDQAYYTLKNLVYSAIVNMPSVEAGTKYSASQPIVYLCTDNFGKQYRFDTRIYNSIITKPYLSVDTAKLGPEGEAKQVLEYDTNDIPLPNIINFYDLDDFSVRDAEQVKLEIDVPDSISISSLLYGKTPDLVKIHLSNGAIQELTPSNNQTDMPPLEGSIITKIEVEYAKISQTNGLGIKLRVTANEQRQDGSNVIFGKFYEKQNNQIVTDCDTDNISVSMSYTGIRNHSETKVVPIYFKLKSGTSQLGTKIGSAKIEALDADFVTKTVEWKVTDTSGGTATSNEVRNNVSVELKVPDINSECIQIMGLTSNTGGIAIANQNYTLTAYYTDGTSENIPIESNGKINWVVADTKTVDKVLLNAEEMKVGDKTTISVKFRVNSAKFIDQYGFVDPNTLYLRDGTKINALQSIVGADNIDLEKDSLFSYGELAVVTTRVYESSVYAKAVENTIHTLTNQLVQTDVVSTQITFETKYFDVKYRPILVLDCAKIEVKLGIHDYLDYVENSAVLKCDANEYHVTSERQEGSNLFLTFENVDIKAQDGSNEAAGYPFTVTIDTKPYYNAVSGDAYTNISINNQACTVTLDSQQQSRSRYPYLNIVLEATQSGSRNPKSGNLTILQTQVERLDNYGETAERTTVDYGPYLILEGQDFDYNLFVFAESNQPMTDVTQYIVIPRRGTAVKTSEGEDKISDFDTILKGIVVQASNTDCNYQVYYTTEEVKGDNSETYLLYNDTLTVDQKAAITKIKITSDKSYWGDLITFTLSHPTGGNKNQGFLSTYLSSNYTYTGILASEARSGNTTAVEYTLDNRAEYAWTVTPQSLQYTAEAENQQTPQPVVVTVTSTGKQPIDSITVSGCEDWIIVTTPRKTATGFVFEARSKVGLTMGPKQGALTISADPITGLSAFKMNASKKILQEVTPPTTPTEPQTPVVPSTPENPQTPVVPSTPENPQTPVVPSTLENPQTPVVPSTPENPQTPVVPSTPANPTAVGNQVASTTEQNTSDVVSESENSNKNGKILGMIPNTGDDMGIVAIVVGVIAVISLVVLIYCAILRRREDEDKEM